MRGGGRRKEKEDMITYIDRVFFIDWDKGL